MSSAPRTPRHVRKNRRYWDGAAAEYQRLHGAQLNDVDRPRWGVWGIPESSVGALGDVAGLDVLEYGCGGAQWSIALARKGARVVGIDLSIEQLRHGVALAERVGTPVPLVTADGERLPFADASFDLVVCDHGAMTFADPEVTVPEVARVLRPGGRLVFNHSSAFHFVCWDDRKDRVGERLARDYFGMRRWDEESVDFMLPYGEWIRLFRRNGFSVEDLIELRPPANARSTYAFYAPLAWARRFPAESLWVVRRTA
ncbi:MAG: class I SAM-dependent methyltransferase [Actinomycetota bacterium]